jgi:hypothetical protein
MSHRFIPPLSNVFWLVNHVRGALIKAKANVLTQRVLLVAAATPQSGGEQQRANLQASSLRAS